MNATPAQPDPNERAELARLLPGPVERDLPGDRHQHLQEFVMSQIHQDLQTAEQAPRRSSKRRLVLLASALTAAAAAAAVVVVGTSDVGGSEGGSVPPAAGSVPSAVTEVSGQQILLAAATTAARTPEGSGTYWHVKVVSASSKTSKPSQWETWTQRDGEAWFRGEKTNGDLVKMPSSTPFRLGGVEVSLKQLQELPTTPDALKAWIANAVKNGGVKTSAGPLNANQQEQFVFEGLISLVSQLPAPPSVRAAAFQAIAAYPNVTSLGAVKGGQGLLISFGEGKSARLVVDPATSQIRESNFFVPADGGEIWAADDSAGLGFTLVAEWTNLAPK
jgi:hypothetical protein